MVALAGAGCGWLLVLPSAQRSCFLPVGSHLAEELCCRSRLLPFGCVERQGVRFKEEC